MKIIWQTIDGKWHEMTVAEELAQAQMDNLRSRPDVKTHTVRLSM